jgi:hypothetical protein
MTKTLQVRLNAPAPQLVHRFHNFGEQVYRALRDECEISLDEIDASTSEFHLHGIHKRDLRTVAAKVRELAEKSKMASLLTIGEVIPMNDKK